VRHHQVESLDQSRAGCSELVTMRKREAFEEAFTARTDSQQNFARIGMATGAFEQSLRFEAAAQFDRTVVADLQALGEHADRGGQRGRQSF
jgi:cytochrome c peroxidase